MPSGENEVFGKIAVKEGYCTAEQVERCLRIQHDTTEGLSLGQSLLREGFITDEQYSKVLTLQRIQSRRKPPGMPPA